MDYEKKYKEALEIAKKELQACGSTDCDAARQIFRFFPELKESEDDMIRKAIKKALQVRCDGSRIISDEPVTLEEALAWLEKQVEQKHTDKVEPKFHVGDWVIDERGIIDQITDVIENVTNHTYGYDTINGEYFNDYTEGVRLWTIQDAKDGDVLAAHECLVLFREIDGLNIRCYCTYNFMNNQSFYVDTLQNKDAFHPATEEQRDLLFQKMHEAGYEWDAEKKELKLLITNGGDFLESENREQNPAWSEEDENRFNNLIFLVECNNENEPTKKGFIDFINRLKSLRP